MGGCFGSLGANPLKAIGGLGAQPPAPESGGKAYSRWMSGGGAPTLKNFAFFLQKYPNFRANLINNNAFKTWHRN